MVYLVLYQVSTILTCIGLGFLLVLTWKYRGVNGGKAMLGLIVSAFIWAFCALLETNSQSVEGQILFYKLGFIGLMAVTPLWLLFSINYTTGGDGITGWKAVPFWIYPILVVAHVVTGAWSDSYVMYGDVLAQTGGFLVLEKTYGPLFWTTAAHNYAIILIGSIILIVRLFQQGSMVRKQSGVLVLAVIIPLVLNVIYTFAAPEPHKDFTPVCFGISAVLLVLGITRFNLFMIKPVAREFVISSMKDGVLVFDLRNTLIEANPAAFRLLSISQKDIGKDGMSIPVLSLIFERFAFSEGETIEMVQQTHGVNRYVQIEYTQMHDKNKRIIGMLMIVHDTTEHKQMQQQMNAQDRLASIGELTSGVAHEINNPLAIIKGLAELLIDSDIPSSAREDVCIINDEVERASGIVNNLLTFARKQPGEKVPIDLNETITKTIALRSYSQKTENIQTVLDLSPNLPKVPGNEIQLRQVLLNIIINAEHFLKEKGGSGKLIITTEKSRTNVFVHIADNGPGISKHQLNRIFEPFFTTKGIGQGTGLGLSICHGIVTEHGGKIAVDSIPGKGTKFTVQLPAMPDGEVESSNFYDHRLPGTADDREPDRTH